METDYVFPIGRAMGPVDYLQPGGSFVRQLAMRNGSTISRVPYQFRDILSKLSAENMTEQEVDRWIEDTSDEQQFEFKSLLTRMVAIKSIDIQDSLDALKFRPTGECIGIDEDGNMSLRTETTFQLAVSPHTFQFWLHSFDGHTIQEAISLSCKDAELEGTGHRSYVKSLIIVEIESLLLNRAGYLEKASIRESSPEYIRRTMFVTDSI